MANSSKFEVKVDMQLPGIITVMQGFWNEEDVNEWAAQFSQCVSKNFGNKPFKVLADMRQYKPASKQVQEKVAEIQKNARSKQLTASAVVTDSALSLAQMKRIAKEAGIDQVEDYFTDYQLAFDWLKSK